MGQPWWSCTLTLVNRAEKKISFDGLFGSGVYSLWQIESLLVHCILTVLSWRYRCYSFLSGRHVAWVTDAQTCQCAWQPNAYWTTRRWNDNLWSLEFIIRCLVWMDGLHIFAYSVQWAICWNATPVSCVPTVHHFVTLSLVCVRGLVWKKCKMNN